MSLRARDVAIAVRTLARSPGFTLAAIGTLALGIGVVTALFALVHGVLLAPLPYPQPERLVRVQPAAGPGGTDPAAFSLPDFRDWAARGRTLSSLALYTDLPGDLVLSARRPEEVETAYVAGAFFQTLGVEPQLGSWPEAADPPRDPHRLVLSDALWRRSFGAREGIVGSTVDVEGVAWEVIAVMPPGFDFPSAETEAWAPLASIPASSIPLHVRGVRFLEAVGRLAPGETTATARGELSSIAGALAGTYPDSNEGLVGAAVTPLRESLVGSSRKPLLVLQAGVVLVLLIACANVATLLLVRGGARRREMAIRVALGAGARRLGSQVLLETALLAAAAGALAVPVARVVVALVVAGRPELPRLDAVRLDTPVLLFTTALTLGVALLCGCLPAWRAVRARSGLALRRGGAGAGPAVGRGALVLQTAMAAVLLVAAGLLARSLGRLAAEDPGFRPAGLLSVRLGLSDERYPERPQYLEAWRRILEELGAVPGVTAAGFVRDLPLVGRPESVDWELPGGESRAPGEARRIQVSPGGLRTLGVPLERGRDVEWTDLPGGPPVAVVNETLAREAFGGSDPVGRRFSIGGDVVEVVGVAADVRHGGLDEKPLPVAYLPQLQNPRRSGAFLLRTEGDPAALVPAVRDALARVDPAQAISEVATGEQIVGRELARPRWLAALVGTTSLVGILLTLVGAYGVTAQEVRRSLPDLAVRVALGAGRARVGARVLAGAAAAAGVGLLLGLALAAWLGSVLGSLVFGVRPLDPPSYGLAALAVLAVVAAASVGPLRRALRVDPARILQEESGP
ncbi:MAG: ADOP family duplicated permease [Thermoanaerobaculia bacterium]